MEKKYKIILDVTAFAKSSLQLETALEALITANLIATVKVISSCEIR